MRQNGAEGYEELEVGAKNSKIWLQQICAVRNYSLGCSTPFKIFISFYRQLLTSKFIQFFLQVSSFLLWSFPSQSHLHFYSQCFLILNISTSSSNLFLLSWQARTYSNVSPNSSLFQRKIKCNTYPNHRIQHVRQFTRFVPWICTVFPSPCRVLKTNVSLQVIIQSTIFYIIASSLLSTVKASPFLWYTEDRVVAQILWYAPT